MSEYIIKATDWAIDYKGESLFKGCEEIVRCEDCKYWRMFYPESEQRFGTCRAWRYTTRFDGYCHNASKVDGERQSE